MIIEDEHNTDLENDLNYIQPSSLPSEVIQSNSSSSLFEQFLQRYQAIRHQSTHQLKNDLIEHLWKKNTAKKEEKCDRASLEKNTAKKEEKCSISPSVF